MRCLPLALAVSLPTLTLSSVTWYQTSSSNGDKLSSKTPLEFDKLHSPTSSSHAVNIDPETTYQAILGEIGEEEEEKRRVVLTPHPTRF